MQSQAEPIGALPEASWPAKRRRAPNSREAEPLGAPRRASRPAKRRIANSREAEPIGALPPAKTCRARKRKPKRPPSKPLLWRAAEAGNYDEVRCRLGCGDAVDERFQGWTPLIEASESGSTEVIELLLAWGANMEARNHRGRTALSFAACPSMGRRTSLDAVKFLLESGADFRVRDNASTSIQQTLVREHKRNSELAREAALLLIEEFEAYGCIGGVP